MADQEDQSQVFLRDFKRLVTSYGGSLQPSQFEAIRLAFPGKEAPGRDGSGAASGDGNNTMCLVRLYDQKYAEIMQDVYKKVDVEHLGENDDADEELGYLGVTRHYREKRTLVPITMDELVRVVHAAGDHPKKLKEIMFAISTIDRTGFITKSELDDIIKLSYPELVDRDLTPAISKYRGLQNKICIDYRSFRDDLVQGLARLEGNNSVKVESFLDEIKAE